MKSSSWWDPRGNFFASQIRVRLTAGYVECGKMRVSPGVTSVINRATLACLTSCEVQGPDVPGGYSGQGFLAGFDCAREGSSKPASPHGLSL